ncbi:Serine/threonine-protein kinase PK-1 [Enhygromyxa salina]|uniref:Serine/threonine-protein kinase PK-1 n=1 Tax=Enhygromyxa salina TaxID=215803 RepID=A0A2S9YHQ3_9BACT|nr:tetratricopeptide repeat protein [Enhygromyxa salina]PRQ04645.1 Serine/threonine-protein kinase PK-1 [Enhygromyxa salina]
MAGEQEASTGWEPTVDNEAGLALGVAQPQSSPGPGRGIGRFVILRLLGEGGMGKVYVGYDEQLDRKVAIKLLRPQAAAKRAEQRLVREAQALARLSHPNVVQVYEAGTDAGAVFIAMEIVDGRTLSEWAAEHTSWRARLEALIQAGRGLAAAHAAGLVHRDFKPDNVLVGRDGRVRVLDFGLVRSVTAEVDADDEALEITAERGGETTLADEDHSRTLSPGRPAMLGADLTVRGTLMGTPIYMAPEQHRGAPCDAAADQFSFCVSAFEVLFGVQPYPAGQLRALAEAKHAGDIETIPSESPVPRAVREAIARGLAASPGARWPDMEALLAALERGLERRRPWRIPAVAAAVVAATLGLGFGLRATAPSEVAQCELDASALAEVWDEPRREAMRAAFEATSLRFESDAARQAERSLDDWSERWLAERRSSCRATRIEGTQSEALLDRREACLGRQLAQFDAIVDVLAAADERVVIRVAPILGELPDLGACSVAALDAEAEADADAALAPEQRAEVEAEFRALARARVELRVGRPQVAAELAEAALARGRGLDHAPLVIEAQAVLAKLEIDAGDLEGGLEQLREAVLAAERAGLLDLVASLRVSLARAAAGDFAQPVLERWMIDEAELALERVARANDPRELRLLVARARVIEQAGDYDEAIAAHTRAYALSEGRLDEAGRAKLRVGIGTALYRAGNYEAARAELEGSLAVVRESWGPWAPEVARIEFNLGMIASDLGEPERAQEHLSTAISIDEQLWGDGSLEVARDRFAVAYLAFATGDLDRGCELNGQVLTIYERELGPEHDETAAALTGVGLCHYYADEFEQARTSYRRALDVQRRLLGDEHYEVGVLRYNIAEVQLALGEVELARAGYEAARDIFAAGLPETHALHALPLKGLGLTGLETGAHAEALAALERALELADASQAVELGEIHFGLARALVATSGEQARATEHAEAALRAFEHAGVERQSTRVRAWLDGGKKQIVNDTNRSKHHHED